MCPGPNGAPGPTGPVGEPPLLEPVPAPDAAAASWEVAVPEPLDDPLVPDVGPVLLAPLVPVLWVLTGVP